MSNSISHIDVTISGLRAQSARMRAISNNIANAQTTDVGGGKPYRRRVVSLSAGDGELGGVQVGDIKMDYGTEFGRIFDKGHPDADKNGYVTMPNVTLPKEMMDMVAASRAYQASTAVLKKYKEVAEATLELLR